MSYLVFTNRGEIDARLITTLGVNAKPNSTNPFGKFGTGLKYAIAGIYRLGGWVTIHSGETELTFSKAEETLRDQNFTFLFMHTDGGPSERLAFTTELGKTWQPWMLARELYCNAMDEGGFKAEILSVIPWPKADQTQIIIKCDALAEAWHKRAEWILDPTARALAVAPIIEIYPWNSTSNFYYKGIKVGTLAARPLFTYNIVGALDLTEDRTAYDGDLKARLVTSLLNDIKDPNIIRDITTSSGKTECFETTLGWHIWSQPSQAFINEIMALRQNSRALIAPGLLSKLAPYLPREEPKSVPLTSIEQQMLDRAKIFLATVLRYHITQPIVVVESLGSQWIAGMATNGTIYLPISTFGKGTKFLASTLLEEHLHIAQKLSDCSRELQDYLMDKIVSLGEELNGEPL